MPAIIKHCIHNDDGFYLMWHMLQWALCSLECGTMVGLMCAYITADLRLGKSGADDRVLKNRNRPNNFVKS